MADEISAGRGRLSLVLGGARSGKSRKAQEIAMGGPSPWTFIATAEALDAEMASRIATHRTERGAEWTTVEAPLDLPRALLATAPEATVLVDCVTLWLSNLMLKDRDLDAAATALEVALHRRSGVTVMVSNEVGLSIVPDNALGRRFRDEAGKLNQRLAAAADHVLLMVAGLPITLKGQP